MPTLTSDILLEALLRDAEELRTERHVRLDLGLLAHEAAVLHAREPSSGQLCKLGRVVELVLRGGKAGGEDGGALERWKGHFVTQWVSKMLDNNHG